jgi:hypothetical protein
LDAPVMNLGNFNEKQIVLIIMEIQAIFSVIPFLKDHIGGVE